MENLIKKINNIEKNTGQVERNYRLGGSLWYIGYFELFVDGHRANGKEIEIFLKLKEEFDNI